jgi:hypothetical protein
VASCSFADWGAVANRHARDNRTGGKLCDLSPAELARLVCPRPLQAQAGVKDTLLTIDQSRAQADLAAQAYREAGAGDHFVFEAFDGDHEFRGDLAWPFLERYLGR